MCKKSIVGVVQDLEDKKKSMESQIEQISETLELLKNTIEYEYSYDYKNSKNGIAGDGNKDKPFLSQNMIESLEEILKKNTKKYSNKNVIL